jgi:hypothetical protein
MRLRLWQEQFPENNIPTNVAEQLVTGLGGEGKRLGIKDALETFGLLHL